MIIWVDRKYTVNMGNYESLTFGGGVSVRPGDLGYTDEQVLLMDTDVLARELQDFAEETVTHLLDDQLDKAYAFTTEQRSVVRRMFTRGEEEKDG